MKQSAGDCFIVTEHTFFDGCELSVDEPGSDFCLDLDYFDPEEGVIVKSESDQIIVYEICGIQFCKDLSSGTYQLYEGERVP